MDFLLQVLTSIQIWILDLWWVWTTPLLAYLAHAMWLAYAQEYYRRSIQWTMMELRIPREIRKTPRAMEQVFVQINAIKNSAGDLQEVYWDGEVPMWFSCEMVSFGGEIHMYLRVPEPRRKHVESAIYAQYPDIQISIVEDYIDRLPQTFTELIQAGYRLFGNELIFSKPAVYPITTYLDFEATQEEKELDPVSTLLETLSSIPPTAHLWMQILIRPKVSEQTNFFQSVDHIGDFVREGEAELSKLKEKTGRRQVFSPQFGSFIMMDRSPGEIELLKAVDRKTDKPAFDAVIRYMYIAPKDVFSSSFGRRSILAALNQYASEWLNKFSHNTSAWTITKLWNFPHIFPSHRAKARATRLYDYYRQRKLYPTLWTTQLMSMRLFDWGFRPNRFSNIVLNCEELATIFHPPTSVVLTGPIIKRMEARKIGPPAGLPIYGDGEKLPGIEEDSG